MSNETRKQEDKGPFSRWTLDDWKIIRSMKWDEKPYPPGNTGTLGVRMTNPIVVIEGRGIEKKSKKPLAI